MWSWSSIGYSAPHSRRPKNRPAPGSLARAAVVAGAVLAAASPPTLAQSDLGSEVDEVTRRVLTDPFVTLRFVSLSLETPDEQGQALNGLVRALLVRGNLDGALEEIRRIDDDLWHARSLAAVGDYFEGEEMEAEALDYLGRAVERLRGMTEFRDDGDLLRVIAKKQAKLGRLEAAIASAELIPDPAFRVKALQEAASASYERGRRDSRAAEAAVKVLAAAAEQARRIEDTGQETAHVIMDIGRAQTTVGDVAGARRTLLYGRDVIAKGEEEGRYRAYARLSAEMAGAGMQEQAMEILREIPEGAQRARGVSSIARSLSERGNDDAIVPLFTLAVEEAGSIDDRETRHEILGHIVREQTRVGRLADAFTTAGAVREALPQARVLLGMARELLDANKLDEALILTDYIPYLGMRAQIFGAVALARGRQGLTEEASALLARAFEPTGFEIQTDYLPDAIDKVLAAQVEIGDPQDDALVFGRARDLAEQIPDEMTKIRVLTRLATAEAMRGHAERANRTLSGAWRDAWLNRTDPNFPIVLQDIVNGQLAIGDVLSAFDTAARIPAPEGAALDARSPSGVFTAPRFASLMAVAAAAARRGETDLAIRAARQMQHPPARAAGIAAVAMSIEVSTDRIARTPAAAAPASSEEAGEPAEAPPGN